MWKDSNATHSLIFKLFSPALLSKFASARPPDKFQASFFLYVYICRSYEQIFLFSWMIRKETIYNFNRTVKEQIILVRIIINFHRSTYTVVVLFYLYCFSIFCKYVASRFKQVHPARNNNSYSGNSRVLPPFFIVYPALTDSSMSADAILPTEYTEWQRPLSGVHSIIMEKSAQAGEGGGCTANPFHVP
jgi:hypothetical protein